MEALDMGYKAGVVPKGPSSQALLSQLSGCSKKQEKLCSSPAPWLSGLHMQLQVRIAQLVLLVTVRFTSE